MGKQPPASQPNGNPMHTPYLIQRGTFKEVKGPITGIDMLVRHDYMGSSEFEFGALPRSLKIFCKHADSLTIVPTDIKTVGNEGVFILCTADQDADTIIKYIKNIKDEKYRLKESARFASELDKPHSRRYDIWWDIENHYMFCIGKENCRRLQKAIIAVRDRKRAEKSDKEWY